MSGYIAIVAGSSLAFIAFIMNTENFRSSIIFRIVPGLLGLFQIAAGLIALGWVQ